MGEALTGKRDQVILATKCGHYGTNGKSTFDFSADRVVSSLEESLARLQTDYIDVFQAHDINAGGQSQIINETVPAMLRLKEAGKVRFVGITGMVDRFLREVAQATEVDTVLSFCHYDLVDTSLADDLGPFAQENDLGMINASPLHMRLLTRKGPPDWYRLPELVVQKVQEADAYCAERGFEISDLAMALALRNPCAATTLVGMSKVRHLTRNLAALDAKISPEVMADVLEILEPATAALVHGGREEQPGHRDQGQRELSVRAPVCAGELHGALSGGEHQSTGCVQHGSARRGWRYDHAGRRRTMGGMVQSPGE